LVGGNQAPDKADRDLYADANRHAYDDAHADPDLYADANRHAYGDAHANHHAEPYVYGDSDAPDAYGHSDAPDAYGDSDASATYSHTNISPPGYPTGTGGPSPRRRISEPDHLPMARLSECGPGVSGHGLSP
jgi:hypothetical protein